MKICVNCDSPYMEPRGLCDSDKCAREDAEYERYCEFNGDHCFDCFLEAVTNGVPLSIATAQDDFDGARQTLLDAPMCPCCHSSEQVYPMMEGMEMMGWMCKVCAWTKME